MLQLAMHATWIWLYQNKSPNSLISDDGIPFLKSLEVMIEIFDYLVFEISRCLISRIFSFAFVKLKVRF